MKFNNEMGSGETRDRNMKVYCLHRQKTQDGASRPY